MKTPTSPVDDFLAGLSPPQRETLEQVRASIRALAPDMEERISSGAPFFWFRGRRAVGYGAAQKHLSFYIMHGQVLKAHRKDLAGFDTSSTVVKFTPEHPLPEALIRKLVLARLEEIRAAG
jgi:uncharacterized protein YdhG (YjbR/CyaY superfamily)